MNFKTLMLAAMLLAASLPAASKADPARDKIVVETLLRLPGYDLDSNPTGKAAVLRHLATIKGQPQYLELVEKLNLRDAADTLAELAVEMPDSTEGVKAASLLFRFQLEGRLVEAINGKDPLKSENAARVLGQIGNQRCVEILQPLLTDNTRSNALRNTAAVALGRNIAGQRVLLKLAADGQLPKVLEFSAANALLASADANIRKEAAKYLSLPASAGSKPLPPVAELAKRTGDVAAGKQLFSTKGTCNKCHKALGEGKEVGPDLSEIGSKLSRDAMYVSILNPSAGVSHNFETYAVITVDGNILTGIKISETDDSVTIKNAEAIEKTIAKEDIDELVKQDISLMPADLQKNLSEADLVDIVEFLMTLKKKS